MTQIDILRNSLIDKLFGIKNEKVLRAVETLLKQSSELDIVYELSESQLQDLQESENQIKMGQTIDHDQLIMQARQWLKEK